LLEEGNFRGRTADFIYMLLFGGSLMLFFVVSFEAFSKIKFLGHPLAFMMVYLWARNPENVHMRMNLMGLFPFNAPYLPWVLLLFSLFIGNPIETDLLGILVGHMYYFLVSVYPRVADIRGWSCRKLLVTPSILKYACGERPHDDGLRVVDMPLPAGAGAEAGVGGGGAGARAGGAAAAARAGHLHQD
jgi:Derlin-2/3